jgi:hypothetical protein
VTMSTVAFGSKLPYEAACYRFATNREIGIGGPDADDRSHRHRCCTSGRL